MRPALLHNASPFAGLLVALVGLFNLILIGVYTRMWIPVGIAIAIFVSAVVWLFLNLWNEYIRIRSKYTDDEAKHFNSRARYFVAGNILVMFVAMMIFLLIRHAF